MDQNFDCSALVASDPWQVLAVHGAIARGGMQGRHRQAKQALGAPGTSTATAQKTWYPTHMSR